MLYDFHDVNEGKSYMNDPSEDVSIDGGSLSNAFGDELRVLYTKDRLSYEMETETSGALPGRDGEMLFEARLPVRKIVVGCLAKTSDSASMTRLFHNLRQFLYRKDAPLEISFADDADFVRFGYCTALSDPEPGELCSKFEIEFTCLDPYRYSTVQTKDLKSLTKVNAWMLPYKLIRFQTTPASNTILENRSNGQKIVVNESVGRSITVDFEKAKILSGSLDVTHKLAFESSDFPDFAIHEDDVLVGSGTMTFRVRAL